MSEIERIAKFLEDAGTYFLATVEGNQPRVRPFGTVLVNDGKLYIQTGKSKNVAKQIAENANVEICACKGGEWLRISGELCEDNRRDIKVAMLEKMPDLKAMYSPDDESMLMLYFKNGKATFSSFSNAPETLSF